MGARIDADGPQPNPGGPAGQQNLVRSDSAGATHAFADACREAGVGFSFGYELDTRVRDAVEVLHRTDGWYPAIDSDGDIRDGAWAGLSFLRVPDIRTTFPQDPRSHQSGVHHQGSTPPAQHKIVHVHARIRHCHNIIDGINQLPAP